MDAITFDKIERTLRKEYDWHAEKLEHFAAMVTLRGEKWSHAARVEQKMKDDLLAIRYAYIKGGRSLSRLTASINEVIEERRERIAWLRAHPKESPKHISRAEQEIDYFAHLLSQMLHTAAQRKRGKTTHRQREAKELLASI